MGINNEKEILGINILFIFSKIMAEVFLDLEKIKRPNSGLGQFCLYLSRGIALNSGEGFLGVYIPKNQFELFSNSEKKEWKAIHKVTGVNVKAKIWHSFHQEAVYFPKNKSIKKILTIHDLNFLDKYSGRKKSKKLQTLQRLVDQSSAVTFISNYTQSVAKKHLVFSKGIMTQVIYNGIALNRSIRAKKPNWIIDPVPFLFSIGIIGEKKNFHVLVEMMNHLPDLILYISGKKETSYSKLIEALIEKHELTNRVFLTGEIEEGEKNWMYKNCSAFVFPSKNEGFGLPVVEAMSFGQPLILSELTSLPEIGGELANYFPSFEAQEMALVVKEAINQHSLERKGELIKRTELFNWNKAAQNYLIIYDQLLKEY